jgi:hypothetical protein
VNSTVIFFLTGIVLLVIGFLELVIATAKLAGLRGGMEAGGIEPAESSREQRGAPAGS